MWNILVRQCKWGPTGLACAVTSTIAGFRHGTNSTMLLFTCDWLLLPAPPPPQPPPPPAPPPPVPPPAPPLPALLDCWWLAISAILLSICSKRSRIDILNWLSGQKVEPRRRTCQWTSTLKCEKRLCQCASSSTNNPKSWHDKYCIHTVCMPPVCTYMLLKDFKLRQWQCQILSWRV